MSYTLSDYDYTLPPELIAQQPATPRDSARLLVSGASGAKGGINAKDYTFADLPSLLKAGDILVTNNTRVLPARLYGYREKVEIVSDGANLPYEVKGKLDVEVLLHRYTGNDNEWLAFCKPAKKLKPGHTIFFGDEETLGEADVVGRDGDQLILNFKNFGSNDAVGFESFLKQAGELPLPPYIERPDGNEDDDNERYQTVYAKRQGAVAAPTAGLHFTPELLRELEQKGIETAQVTLHVGAGTFQPVRSEDLSEHIMHKEWGEITPETVAQIESAKARGGRVICVGTTSMRIIETASQSGTLKPFKGDTDIFIQPGYTFKTVDGLITNFHLPKSTLLMLVAAFVGHDEMHQIYKTAIAEKYRFYSYGDSSLLWRK